MWWGHKQSFTYYSTVMDLMKSLVEKDVYHNGLLINLKTKMDKDGIKSRQPQKLCLPQKVQ